MMKKLIIVLIISLKLVANDKLSFSFATLHGISTYEVWQDSTALKSKLIFPFSAKLLQLEYDKKFSDEMVLSFKYASRVDSQDKRGEDYDWQQQKLTVYSSSKNSLKSYQSFLLAGTYKSNILRYTLSLSYSYTKLFWYDTSQTDFVIDKKLFIHDKTVSYQQNRFLLGFSPSYSYQSKKLILSLIPSIYYGVNFTKDRHISREFDAKATYKGLSYGAEAKVEYEFLSSAVLMLYYESFYFDDHDILEYESREGFNYLSLPSSFSQSEHTLGFGIKLVF